MPIDSESENRVLNGSSTLIRPMLTVRVLLFLLICFSFRILVGGTIERWEDPFFRKCFEKILNGNWRDHDPFSLEGRLDARSSLYGRPSQSSIFRTFQGWLAMRYRFHWHIWEFFFYWLMISIQWDRSNPRHSSCLPWRSAHECIHHS